MLGRPWWHHRVQGRRPQCALPHLCLSLLICEAGQDSPQSRAEVGLCGSSAFPAHSCPLHLGLLPRAPRWACGCGERMGQGAGISPTDKEGGAEGRAQRQGGGLPLAVCAAHAGQGNHVQLSLPLLLNHVGFPSPPASRPGLILSSRWSPASQHPSEAAQTRQGQAHC